MNLPFLPDSEIDAAALRLKLEALPGGKVHELPVDLNAIVFDYLCERDTLSVDFECNLPAEHGEEVLGKTTMAPGRIQISGHLQADTGRFRFTLAHEIGHWILHRPLILAALDQPGLFGEVQIGGTLTTLNRSVADATPLREEIQANRFAASLLIDHKTLRGEFASRFGSQGPGTALKEAGLGSAPSRAQARFLATAGGSASLARHFGVSGEAMTIALLGRKYLPEPGSLFPD